MLKTQFVSAGKDSQIRSVKVIYNMKNRKSQDFQSDKEL
jgi:hypothetical protein